MLESRPNRAEMSIMNQKALRTLEYDKIIEKLTEYAASEPAKALCRELLPSSDYQEIVKNQAETTDADETDSSGNPVPSDAAMEAALEVDAEADPALLTQEGVLSLDLLEPYGAGNPKPVF